MGLIGGSLYKAALQAGYDTTGFDLNDPVHLEKTDILLLALPQEALHGWLTQHGGELPEGSIVVDTCGVKREVCREAASRLPPGRIFVGGHPMAGREHSGFAYAEATLFRGASMILTPPDGTPRHVLERLEMLFTRLGFERVLITTPEHHDRMIAYTSHLSHVIAAAYTQEPLSSEAAGYAAGSYANMTRIASMNPVTWQQLFSTNSDNLLPILDGFIGRLVTFRDALANQDTESLRNFIRDGAVHKATDGIRRTRPHELPSPNTLGHHLKLEIYGASHAPAIGMRLDNMPRGIPIDMQALQAFMERRAPGRDPLSTARREPDVPAFLSGLQDGHTTGGRIEAIIRNTDTRPADYGAERTVPRPGHADFPQWVQNGRIPTGGGANSGRMTAPMCIAGGICLQWLAQRGIQLESRLVSAGGDSLHPEEAILAAKQAGDSVGGVIELRATGLPAGLGGAMFAGLESRLSEALFGIPGVKGIEFGSGFRGAESKGSENNDSFLVADGVVATSGNNHGGILGGMTTGMPIVLRLAMKPTPSIYMEQQSVDLATGEETPLVIQGRHDPCIARRALPVAEAIAAFVLADIILETEARAPRICLTLTEPTLAGNLAALRKSRPFVDMAELRVDHLLPEERLQAHRFPEMAGIPVILTIRRQADGGQWQETEEQREELFSRLLQEAPKAFAYVDFEEDFRNDSLEKTAHSRGTRIIRSLHDFNGPVENIIERCQQLKGSSDDIPKIAFKANHCSDLTRLFRETADFTGFPHILCAMGEFGMASRILAVRTHSMLTFASPAEAVTRMGAIGHLSPQELVRTYRFRSLTEHTALYAVTGWPLGHTASPTLNNDAFFAQAKDAVMVPIPAETAQEALACAETLGVRGMAVTIPHKQDIMHCIDSIDDSARSIGAVNTVVHTITGWRGFNTDVTGFEKALLTFLGLPDLRGRKVALLGAGGAARAVSCALARMGADACIFNHTYAKARELAALYSFKSAPLAAESLPLLEEYGGIIVQATSVGLNTNSPEADPIPFYAFKGTECLYDLIYKPEVTPLMTRAAAAGCRTQNGMSMLIAQAQEQRRLYAIYNGEQ